MSSGKCPFSGGKLVEKPKSNDEWWPNQLDISPLTKPSPTSNPMDIDFDYASEFKKLDLDALKKDLKELMTTSHSFWPADFGHYGPLFIRMAWHSAGTYRVMDGRGGAGMGSQRFAPLNSWPDNINLDKARRLLWPIKQKYGKSISWADLMILTGNVALESMGLKTYGFGGGREDTFEPDNTYWGPENVWRDNKRYSSDHNLINPLAATEMGLIYVNPEGPGGKPDILASAKEIRETFARMAMNDEETVALIAGGHTFGKAHGAAEPKYVGKEPEAAPIESMGLGWMSTYGKGNAEDTISSGLEGSWTPTPTTWDNTYFKTLFKYEWKQTKSPAGAIQWIPVDELDVERVPDAHDNSKTHLPIMFTTDLALRYDPEYEKISKRFLNDFEAFSLAFAKAWFKLTHRDMGPTTRYLGPDVPKESLLWQDPIPKVDYKEIDKSVIESIKDDIFKENLSINDLINLAWASASSFRKTDKRGGANGARLRLTPQNSWEVNNPKQLKLVLEKLEKIHKHFLSSGYVFSFADLIVISGCLALERAIKNAGHSFDVPFIAGRGDALQEQTDIESFKYLEPQADGFRNYVKNGFEDKALSLLIEKAYTLDLTPPELVVLLGGMRVLNTNFDKSSIGVLTNNKEALTNDFFINLLDPNLFWKPSKINSYFYDAFDEKGVHKWTASKIDLLLASNSQLRAISEVYASQDTKEKFIKDFIKVWHKVMMLDRFDVKNK
jgi:catalase-peroxidase